MLGNRLLITGGAGFIGTALIGELNLYGYETSSVDKNDQHAVSGFSITTDLLLPGEFSAILDETRPDHVIHLAAQVGRINSEDDLRYTIRDNAELTAIVATETQKREIPLCYTSTSEIYGDHGPHRILAEDGPMRLPHNLYGLTKRWGEEVARLYHPENLQIIRPTMPYGPGAPPGRGRRAIDNFLWQANTGQRIPVHKGAERSWCWIGDLVRGWRMVLESGQQGAWNIGRDDDPRPMTELAVMCCEIAGAPTSLIDEIEPPEMVTPVKRLSTDRLRSLGWKPEVELEQGLPMLFDWIKQFGLEGERVAA